jgi:hypothetical protein
MTKTQAVEKAQRLANQEGRAFHVIGDQRRAYVYPEGTLEVVGPDVLVIRPGEPNEWTCPNCGDRELTIYAARHECFTPYFPGSI